MAAQSARAHTFDRRMRWFWLRRSLRDTTSASEDVGDVVDVRGEQVALRGEPPPVAPVVPVPPATAAAPPQQLPRRHG
jgi:hypothetical protein